MWSLRWSVVKWQKIGDYTATKNNHVTHAHDIGILHTGNYESNGKYCKECEDYISRERREQIPSITFPSNNLSNPSSSNNKLNLKNPLVIGGIIIGSLVLIGLIFYFINRKKHHEQ